MEIWLEIGKVDKCWNVFQKIITNNWDTEDVVLRETRSGPWWLADTEIKLSEEEEKEVYMKRLEVGLISSVKQRIIQTQVKSYSYILNKTYILMSHPHQIN